MQYLEIVIESHWECGDRPTPGSLGIVVEIECHSFVGRDRWFSPKYMTEQPPPCLQHFQRNWGLFTFFCRGTYLKFLLGIEFPEPCAAAFDGKSPTFLRLFWSVPMCRNCITELTSLRCYIA